jgi:hypothetical protein
MSKATKVFHEKIRTADGIVVELKVWQVNKSAHYPESFRYSFFAVRNGVTLVGYDNHAPKGAHRHVGGVELRYRFETLEKLRADFTKDLARARKQLSEGE